MQYLNSSNFLMIFFLMYVLSASCNQTSEKENTGDDIDNFESGGITTDVDDYEVGDEETIDSAMEAEHK